MIIELARHFAPADQRAIEIGLFQQAHHRPIDRKRDGRAALLQRTDKTAKLDGVAQSLLDIDKQVLAREVFLAGPERLTIDPRLHRLRHLLAKFVERQSACHVARQEMIEPDVETRRHHPRIKRSRPLEGLRRRLQHSQIAQGNAAVVPQARIIGHAFEQPVIGLQRVAVMPQTLQQIGVAAHGARMAGPERQSLFHAPQGLVETRQRLQDHAAAVPALGIAWIERERPVEHLQRGTMAAQLTQDIGIVGKCQRIARICGQDPLEHLTGLFPPALLRDSHCQHVLRVPVAGDHPQHLPVVLLGARNITLAVTLQCLGHQDLRVHAGKAGFFTLSTISISTTTLFSVRSSFSRSCALILPSRYIER